MTSSPDIFQQVKAAAAGRWIDILSDVAGIPRELLDGQHHPCPKCPDHGKNRFRLIDPKEGAVFCNQCFKSGNGDGISAVAWMLNVDNLAAAMRIAEYLHLDLPTDKGKRTATSKAKKSPTLTPDSSEPIAATEPDEAVAAGGIERASIEIRDVVYREMLRHAPLSEKHRSDLRSRGFEDPTIASLEFGSLPRDEVSRSTIARRVLKALDVDGITSEVLLTVPGFVPSKNNPKLLTLTPSVFGGIMVPIRSHLDSKIIAVKVRVDDELLQKDADGKGGNKYRFLTSHSRENENGPKAEWGAHCPKDLDLFLPQNTIRVTEGELKADFCTYAIGLATISIPGVGGWQRALPIIEQFQAKRVFVSLDADRFGNKAVADAQAGLVAAIRERGIAVCIETWPADLGKGIDDVLAAGHEPILIEGDDLVDQHVAECLASAEPKGIAPLPNEAPDDPHRLSRLFLDEHASHEGNLSLRFWNDEWWYWQSGHGAYQTLPVAELKGRLSSVIKAEFDRLNVFEQSQPRDEGTPLPVARKVTTALLNNVVQAILGRCVLPSHNPQPTWLLDDPPFPAAEFFCTKSGLLHLPSLVDGRPALTPPTPFFFSAGVVEYAFDPNAKCPHWDSFLESVWGDDPDSIASLQEWFGLLLLPDTKHHKILMVIGEKRSGKGTISRILKSLIGASNVANPVLGSLEGPFGLWPLLGKTLALIPDARLTGRTDSVAVVERLLSISGEDGQDVHRKSLPTITAAKIPVRFVVMSNELPNLSDSSGAFTSRVILLQMTKSFYGKEDKFLEERLRSELPGILNWAIHGWARLRDRGYLLQPESGRDALRDLDDMTSPITAFVRDVCIVQPGFSVAVDDLFDAWKEWCKANGREHAGTAATFGKNLRAKFSKLKRTQPRISPNGGRLSAYEGIGLRSGTGWHECQTIARVGQNEVIEAI